jgi:PAS domain S-box-containing protein
MDNKNEINRYKKYCEVIMEDDNQLCCRFLPDTMLTFVNQEYCKFFGKTKQELIGEKFLDLIPEDEKDRVREFLDEFIEERKTVICEHKVVDSNGQIAWQRWKDYLIFDRNDEVVEILSIGRDITKEKKNEEKLKKYAKKIKDQKEELEILHFQRENQLEKASNLHKKLLPKEPFKNEKISFDAWFQPSSKLGGDFYNIIELNNQLVIYMSDVSGHGIDSSMLNIFLREAINHYLLYEYKNGVNLNPKNIVNHIINEYLKKDFPRDYFICLVLGILDLEKMKFSFTNAGFQIAPIHITNNGAINLSSCGGLPISSAINRKKLINLNREDIFLNKGDKIFITTDGLIEEKAHDTYYGWERLREVLSKNYKSPCSLITKKINSDFYAFTGSVTGEDDISFFTLERKFKVIDEFKRSVSSNIEDMNKMKEFIFQYCDKYKLIYNAFKRIILEIIGCIDKKDKNREINMIIEVTKKYIKFSIEDETYENWINKVGFISDDRQVRVTKEINKLYDEIWYEEEKSKISLLKYR